MGRALARATQADIVRAVKAVSTAGVRVGRVDIRPDGTIAILSVDAQDGQPMLGSGQPEVNEWDEVLQPKARGFK